MEDIHRYEVDLEWNYDGTGILSSPVLPESIKVATPPDFDNGVAGIWSPEHLFVAALNSCLLTTFLVVAKRSKFDYISFKSNAVGTVEKIEGKFQFTQITLRPTLKISGSASLEQARRVIEMSEKNCIIANAITTRVMLLPDIIVE